MCVNGFKMFVSLLVVVAMMVIFKIKVAFDLYCTGAVIAGNPYLWNLLFSVALWGICGRFTVYSGDIAQNVYVFYGNILFGSKQDSGALWRYIKFRQSNCVHYLHTAEWNALSVWRIPDSYGSLVCGSRHIGISLNQIDLSM